MHEEEMVKANNKKEIIKGKETNERDYADVAKV